MFSIRQILRSRVHARWSRTWNSELDTALDALPESECCSRELYRLLCTNRDPHKLFAVMEDRSKGPVGVVCLRRREALNDWVPVTHHSIPGMLFPVKEGFLGDVLSVLNRNVWLDWWRMGDFSEDLVAVRNVEVSPTYEIDCSGNHEEYWQKSHHIRPVKRARKRCEGLEAKINGEQMTEWVISKWERKWRQVPTVQRPDLEDKMLIANYLLRRGKYFTFTLHADGRPAAGHTFLAHEKSLVWQYTYRDPEYDELGAGTYLMDAATKWAIKSGFDAINLGGGHSEHKNKWGPPKGTRTSIYLCPTYLFMMHRGEEILRGVRERGMRQSLKLAVTKAIAATRGSKKPSAAMN